MRYTVHMRGRLKNRIRLNNLRLLHAVLSFEEIADKAKVSAPYLSQINKRVIQARGKKPRILSDGYMDKIELGLELPGGWMDVPHQHLESLPKEKVTLDILRTNDNRKTVIDIIGNISITPCIEVHFVKTDVIARS